MSGEFGILAIRKKGPAVSGNPALVVIKVFAPVPMVTEDFVFLMIRPEPCPRR